MNAAFGAGASACAEGITVALGGVCSLRCVPPYVPIADSGNFLCMHDKRSETGAALKAYDEIQNFYMDCIGSMAKAQMASVGYWQHGE